MNTQTNWLRRMVIVWIMVGLLAFAGCMQPPHAQIPKGFDPVNHPPSYEQDKEYADGYARPRMRTSNPQTAIHAELRLIRQLLEQQVEIEEAKLNNE